jgi:hypothetical protein
MVRPIKKIDNEKTGKFLPALPGSPGKTGFCRAKSQA